MILIGTDFKFSEGLVFIFNMIELNLLIYY